VIHTAPTSFIRAWHHDSGEFVKTTIFPKDSFRKIQRLFNDRHARDYDWNIIDKQTAEQDLKDAEYIIELCKQQLKLS
jgi:uncharacterized protein (UPF0332 family)